MKLKKQEGYTLLELIMVIAIMTMISITVMQDRLNEVTQLKAKTLGVEIGNFASGLGSYVDYYSGRDPAEPGNAASPSNGMVKSGVNFLKSSTCGLANGGVEDIGFIPSCEFLSHSKAQFNEKTTFGNLGFETTFIRDNSLPEPFRLEAITHIDSLVGVDGRLMDAEMGIAATVAGGIRVAADGTASVPHVAVYCMTKTGGNALYNKICADTPSGSNVGKIGLYVGQDAAASPYLRTDGGNKMLNTIEFDAAIDHLLRTIENLSYIQLFSDPSTGNVGRLSIGEDIRNPIFKLDKKTLDVITTDTVNFQTPKMQLKNGYLLVDTGYIHAAKGSISSMRSVEAPVFLPATDQNGYSNGTSAINPNANIGYKLVIDGKTELKDVGVDTVAFGKSRTDRAGNGGISKIETKNGSPTALKVKSNELNLESINSSFKLTGDVNVADFNVQMMDNSFKSLSELLPRYTFLGAQSIETYGGRASTVSKSPYEALGCNRSDLKIIVTPQSAFVSGIQHTTANWVEIDWVGVQAAPGYSIGGGKTYQLDNPTKGLTYGNLVVDVTDKGSSWSVLVDTTAAAESGVGDSNYVRTYRGGNALAQIYCLNNVMR